jgi:UDPglucose 6-dehydrogenase
VVVGADALVVATEWNEFKQLDMARIRGLMRRPILLDARNIYDPAAMRALGFVYRGIGRGRICDVATADQVIDEGRRQVIGALTG